MTNPEGNREAKISVGMPVYNGEKSLERALAGVLGQTHHYLRLIISDNASTDGTWKLLEKWAAQDRRISLHRHEENIGGIENFRYLLRAADTEYFLWHAHDDWLAPNYIEELLGILELSPECALACPATQRVRADGSLKRLRPFAPLAEDSRLGRVADLLARSQPTWIYGLFRTGELRRGQRLADEFGYSWAADHIALLHFILNDRIQGTNRTVFYYQEGSSSAQTHRPASPLGILRFAWRYTRFHLKSLRASTLPLGEKIVLFPSVLLHSIRTMHLRASERLVKEPLKRVKAVPSALVRSVSRRR